MGKPVIGIITGGGNEWQHFVYYDIVANWEHARRMEGAQTGVFETKEIIYRHIAKLEDARGRQFDAIIKVGNWMHKWEERDLDCLPMFVMPCSS